MQRIRYYIEEKIRSKIKKLYFAARAVNSLNFILNQIEFRKGRFQQCD